MNLSELLGTDDPTEQARMVEGLGMAVQTPAIAATIVFNPATNRVSIGLTANVADPIAATRQILNAGLESLRIQELEQARVAGLKGAKNED